MPEYKEYKKTKQNPLKYCLSYAKNQTIPSQLFPPTQFMINLTPLEKLQLYTSIPKYIQHHLKQ